MPLRRHSIPAALSIVALFVCGATLARDDGPPAASGTMDFARDVAPIFAKNCVGCHGRLAQKGGLRLDGKERASSGGDTGPVIVAGKATESSLYRYVAGLEADHLMPPTKVKSPRPSADEIGRIRAWIDQGANWPEGARVVDVGGSAKSHWAFERPVRPAVPEVRDKTWPRNPIDRFVLARLEKESLAPSPEADKTTLIRRLSLDLIGLPPTIAEVDEFVADARPDAYDKLVDRLLASPHYGERWARRWLDKARYADTNGYEKDRERSIWPYRDWVIKSLNDDMPFDDFTIAQLAGDMLPNATPADRVASGFHRNTMRNEEGGIDVEEFRYAALVDRVATTGATWLGLTIQCAQCHTHKYDPITHKEYYQFLSYFNNADEPEEYDVPDAAVAGKRAEITREVERLTRDLENQFPATDPERGWSTIGPVEAKSDGGATLAIGADGVVTASGAAPDKDTYVIALGCPEPVAAIRLDALADAGSPAFGPGRTAHGNFVLTGVSMAIIPDAKDVKVVPITIQVASADFTQDGFDPMGTLDGDPRTGWAIQDGSGRLDKSRALTLAIHDWPKVEGPAKLVITLQQDYGGTHTLGRFRFRIKAKADASGDANPIVETRREHLNAKLAAWQSTIKPHRWTILAPDKSVSRKHATMNVKPDGSVLVTGDKPNNDVYEVEVSAKVPRITAIRLETLTDPSLPMNGPGRAPLFSLGDFILTEFVVDAIDAKTSKPIKLANATQDYSEPTHTAAMAIDGVPETGWTIPGGAGKPHAAVFELAEPLEVGENGQKLAITLHQFGIHNTTIGRFRISVTGDERPVRSSGVPAEIEEAVRKSSPEGADALNRYYLSIAPEVAPARAKIDALRRTMPKYTTTLVMEERESANRRATHIHKRGEFLNLADRVGSGIPDLFPTEKVPPRDRLELARWIASKDNPLTSRVTVNGMWMTFFGRGIVATAEDFGTRGDPPSHPELLDWLAVEFPARGWHPKAMHRLIVTSATYRQSSKATAEQMARDPKNVMLARGARFRVDAEVVRDVALRASGLLNPSLGGPSVYPPQPDGVTSLVYGQAAWPTSSGADRYRRGLYTYVKRAAPFAAFTLMDAPSPELACVRRERSNTPLQALTLLNDAAFVEAAHALALRALAEAPVTAEDRARFLVRSCLARWPSDDELAMLLKFHEKELTRFRSGGVDPKGVAGSETKGFALDEVAAWTLTARVVLNLDETITRE